jgi:hypothetical protein
VRHKRMRGFHASRSAFGVFGAKAWRARRSGRGCIGNGNRAKIIARPARDINPRRCGDYASRAARARRKLRSGNSPIAPSAATPLAKLRATEERRASLSSLARRVSRCSLRRDRNDRNFRAIRCHARSNGKCAQIRTPRLDLPNYFPPRRESGRIRMDYFTSRCSSVLASASGNLFMITYL